MAAAHRPLYIDSTDTGRFDADQVVADELRKSLEPLLYEAKVDLVLTGHHHSYQRYVRVSMGFKKGTRPCSLPPLP